MAETMRAVWSSEKTGMGLIFSIVRQGKTYSPATGFSSFFRRSSFCVLIAALCLSITRSASGDSGTAFEHPFFARAAGMIQTASFRSSSFQLSPDTSPGRCPVKRINCSARFVVLESRSSSPQICLSSRSFSARSFGFSRPPGAEMLLAGLLSTSITSSLIAQEKIFLIHARARFACTGVLAANPRRKS